MEVLLTENALNRPKNKETHNGDKVSIFYSKLIYIFLTPISNKKNDEMTVLNEVS